MTRAPASATHATQASAMAIITNGSGPAGGGGVAGLGGGGVGRGDGGAHGGASGGGGEGMKPALILCFSRSLEREAHKSFIESVVHTVHRLVREKL